MTAQSLHGARNQACSQPRVRVRRRVSRCGNFAPWIHGNCHWPIVVFRKTDKFVLVLLAFFTLERDWIGTAKKRCANSP
jgi:hypothetical protein